MDGRSPLLERAFELAREGLDNNAIRAALKREGYALVDSHFEASAALRRALRQESRNARARRSDTEDA